MKKTVLIIFIMTFFTLTACGGLSTWDGVSQESKWEETDNVKEELGSLSEDEKRILSRDGYSAKERIYAGHLYDYEVEKVKNIRGAKEYLANKYPNHEFKITLYESRGNTSSSPTGDIGDDVLWLAVDGENTGKWVKVKETEAGPEFYDCVGDE